MNSQSQLKKIERKLNKLQHVVFKETGITCGPHPSKHLAILNAGLVNGLTDEIIYKHFSKYGEIEHIILIPGKSCSFLSYVKEISASRALQNYNSKLNIAQDNKPIYLSYANKLPDIQKEDCWDKYPPGLILLDNFITDEEEKLYSKLILSKRI
ncbi:hypothetical protein NQ317_008181 [Molorchus minor]|uniref:RRM domain-containing protein n=1 Tax=Molorchus minor TaxID=1323400 RepID=A0ABQ9JL08_9CUCU|nr:hypothetical protein NQ317_008181 [Molorchus minor]